LKNDIAELLDRSVFAAQLILQGHNFLLEPTGILIMPIKFGLDIKFVIL
jgi:hypothetical protein